MITEQRDEPYNYISETSLIGCCVAIRQNWREWILSNYAACMLRPRIRIMRNELYDIRYAILNMRYWVCKMKDGR